MKEEIKERIDKIELGEVPDGYKQTDVGIIPQDWFIDVFGNIADINMGQSPIGESYNNEGIGVPLINGPTEFTDKYPIVKQWTDAPTKMCADGDILICVRGSSTGRINIANGKYCIGRGVAAISNKISPDNSFVSQLLTNIVNEILTLTSGSTFPNLSSNDIKMFKLPIPPLIEQDKIAEILTTWDKAIDLKEKYIRILEVRKKGIMAKLLSPKGNKKIVIEDVIIDKSKWKSVRLGDICETFSGGTPLTSNSDFYKGNIPFIRSAEIGKEKTELFINDEAINNSSAKKVEIGDLLYALYGANSGECSISKINGAINQAILCIRSSKLSVIYLYYILFNNKESITGTYLQGGQGNLSAEIIKSIKFPLASQTEQYAIASILSLIDVEIELCKQELEKLKLQKKSLMQLLLTGIVRVS